MKRVLCYGDSNTFGTKPMRDQNDSRRFDQSERWPCVAGKALGAGWQMVEEGLPGRTTVHDDPIEGAHKNGLTYLTPCLESHWPLDAIVLMLGTNDLKARFGLPPFDIASGVGKLLDAIVRAVPDWTSAPKLFLLCPVPVVEAGWLSEMFGGGAEKSRRLAPLYRAQAEMYGAAFFDAGTVAEVSPVDGVHFEAAGQAAIGKAVAGELKRLLG